MPLNKTQVRGLMINLVKAAMADQYAKGNIKAGRGFAKIAAMLTKGQPLVKAAESVVGSEKATKVAVYLVHRLAKSAAVTKKAFGGGGDNGLMQMLQSLGMGQQQQQPQQFELPPELQGLFGPQQPQMAPELVQLARMGLAGGAGGGIGALMGGGMAAGQGRNPMAGAGRGMVRGGLAGAGSIMGHGLGSGLAGMMGGDPQTQSLGGLAGMLGGGLGGYALGGHMLGPDQEIEPQASL